MKKNHLLALAVPVIFALSACSSGNAAEVDDAQGIEIHGQVIEVDPELAERVPDGFAPGGVLTAPNSLLAPIGFTDENGDDAGVVPDLVHAIAGKLGA